MSSRADLPLRGGVVRIETEAKIPVAGDVRMVVMPQGTSTFALNVRVPSWAVLRAVEINGQSQGIRLNHGYLPLRRAWHAGDRVDVHFDLPLRVVLDRGHGPTAFAEGKVSLDGAAPAAARSIVIYRGPTILTQFRMQNGCDLIWAYTGDDPYLFETVASVPDEFRLSGRAYRHTGTPDLVEVVRTAQGVRLDWTWKTGPHGDWKVRRSAVVRPGIPVEINYGAQITPPTGTAAGQIEEFAQSARLCGTRMLYSVSEPSTYFDKVGHGMTPRLKLDGATVTSAANQWLSGQDAEIDNGFIQYHVRASSPEVLARDDPAKHYCGIYSTAQKRDGGLAGGCRLTITGRSRFE
jgi:hypothetical protein